MNPPGGLGRVLGDRYRLDTLLGQGGMSSVYKATDPNLRRVVAIKLIHPHLTTDPEFVRRFEIEAAAVAQLHHPNIIQVYDFDRDGDTYYMVLEFVAGESLDRRLRRLAAEGRRVPPGEAAEITAEIAEAIDYAHRQGLIHRDIKPANIMLAEDGRAVLMDFGVIKIVGATQHTATGQVVGTAFYISPEQVRGEPPSARSDVYALGVSLFEMLAGRPPFLGDSALTVMRKHVDEPVPDLRRIAPDTPAIIVEAVEKAMAKDPRQRYSSAREMAGALRPGADKPVARSTAWHTPAQEPEQPPAPRRPGPAAATVIDAEPDLPPEPSAPLPPVVLPAAASPRAGSVVVGAPRAASLRPAPPPAAPAAPAAPASPSVAPARPANRRRAWWTLGGAASVLLCLVVAGITTLGAALTLPRIFASAKPTAAALFQDDFSSPGSGWTINSGSKGSANYDSGDYVMQVAEKNWMVWSTGGSGELANVHIEVTAASTGAASDEGFGIICDYSDDSHYYYLGLNANGYYAIVKNEGGSHTILTDASDQWVRSVRIAKAAGSYRLGADCGSDGTLALYADGVQVATATDTTYHTGLVGLFVRTFYQAPAELRFDDLVATGLP